MLLIQEPLWRLASVTVTSEEELHAQRLGYWLRRVREQRGESQKSAALAAGLAASSSSTVSKWESGERPISVQTLRRLAKFYAVPVDLFMSPPMTDDERLAAALADAGALERAGWDLEQERGLATGDAPSSERGTRLQ